MEEHQREVARKCLRSAETGTLAFPQIVEKLIGAGFEGYGVDFRRSVATYYTPDGDFIEVWTHEIGAPIGDRFDANVIQAAIKDAQLAPGYTYPGFCKKIAAAGCVAYIVSFSGRGVLYIGRTAETHFEPFPGQLNEKAPR